VRSDELYVKLLESCMINRKADSAEAHVLYFIVHDHRDQRSANLPRVPTFLKIYLDNIYFTI